MADLAAGKGGAALGREVVQGPGRRWRHEPERGADLHGRQRHDARQDLWQLSRRASDPICGLRRHAGSDGPRPQDRGKILRVPHPRQRRAEHDSHPVREQGQGGQAGAPPARRAKGEIQENRHARRGHDGRGHRLCRGVERHRGRADRPRSGLRRTRQGPRHKIGRGRNRKAPHEPRPRAPRF